MDETTEHAASHLTSHWKTLFRKRLSAWYAKHRRDLPWRMTRDAYRIWVSETMLQQTQVATVVDYYERFLARFPTVIDLAGADEQDVLRLWSGLGYYRRAKQLHAAAQIVAREFRGQMPTTAEELKRLPGIGRYTAGAIASFAYDQTAPILEANTLRLFSRLIGLRENPRSTHAQQQLWDFAEWILPRRSGAGLINQAVMELGSIVCKPRDPECKSCPALALCPTAAQGLQNVIPQAPTKIATTQLHHAAAIMQRISRSGQRQLLMQCYPPGAWWEGLWDVPRVDLTTSQEMGDFDRSNPTELSKVIAKKLLDQFKLSVVVNDHVLTMHHGVTKYRIRLDCFHAQFTSHAITHSSVDKFKWIDFSEVLELPRGSTTNKIIAHLAGD